MAKRSESVWRFRPWLVKGLLLLALVGAFLAALIGAGRLGLEQLRGRERYDVPLADIECVPPAGMARGAFLDEVRYVSPKLPERLHLLNENIEAQLREGFAAHPWVEKVEAIEIRPPRRIVVTLIYRTPVLAVKFGETTRAVDGRGVLLPANASTDGLPVYEGDAAAPLGAAGMPWGDRKVEAAARKALK